LGLVMEEEVREYQTVLGWIGKWGTGSSFIPPLVLFWQYTIFLLWILCCFTLGLDCSFDYCGCLLLFLSHR
jgi:hypothetical protein